MKLFFALLALACLLEITGNPILRGVATILAIIGIVEFVRPYFEEPKD